MTFRLERDGYTPLTLNTANGYVVRRFDQGWPDIRVVSDNRPGGDGADDVTSLFGSKLITMNVLASKDRQTAIDEITPFLAPDGRAFLYYEATPGTERRFPVRGASRQARWNGPPGKLDMLLQWEVPNGTAETATVQEVTASATVPVEPGLTFDLEFDLDFPESSPIGSTIVTTIGTGRCYPILRLYGPCTDPRIENYTDGEKTLNFNISLGTGDYLEVDVRERTVYLNGNPRQSRYSTLEFAESEWWSLVPGDNQVRYYPVSYSGNSRAEISYRCQFI